jgi:hypothetical protein
MCTITFSDLDTIKDLKLTKFNIFSEQIKLELKAFLSCSFRYPSNTI